MIDKVKAIRVNLDALIQVTNNLGNWNDEVKETIRSLKLGKMWLGKTLGQLGEETPYKKGNDASTEFIDPKADTAEIFGDLFEDVDMNNHIQLAKKLRDEIEKEIGGLGGMFNFNNTSNDMGMFANEARINLSEARMWLGEFLSAIKARDDSAHKGTVADAKERYAAYISVIAHHSAPGTKFDAWEELSVHQREGWLAVANSELILNRDPLS